MYDVSFVVPKNVGMSDSQISNRDTKKTGDDSATGKFKNFGQPEIRTTKE
jgi:hypothetical protein